MARQARREAPPRQARRPLEFGCLPGLLGFHLRLASAAVYRDFATHMAPLDLTQKQFAVLELIAHNENVSQVDLAEALQTDRATMMALVDRLAARGLLDRTPSAIDRRRLVLSLSQPGAALLEAARRIATAHEARFAAAFPDAQLDELLASLRQIWDAGGPEER